ncbi:hypothetical protein MKEN_00997400 [Mycena kentingensis (nom. inval.)]|nr:hypothetical protein MKEN_00997400 [Mycena kentingensis (nom. inval.)]
MMHAQRVLGVFLLVFRASRATQTPLFAPHLQWVDLDEAPSPNTTSNLIFDSVTNLLQHWPNTRYRNGHAIVPGTVPVGTLLYHGRSDEHLPSHPEWTATDPEHAYHFCGDTGFPNITDPNPDEWPTNTGCWQLTLVANRPLQVLYFDGSSAANMKDGTLDTQDLLVWGEWDEHRWLDERARIEDLCTWGRRFGVDGFLRLVVRLDAPAALTSQQNGDGFVGVVQSPYVLLNEYSEIMLCNFHDGVDLVSADFLAAWWHRAVIPPLAPAIWDPRLPRRAIPAIHNDDQRPPRPVPPPRIQLIASLLSFETLRAGSWHNHFPGDSRIVLDYTRLVTFYDADLAPSLVDARFTAERWAYRAAGASVMDTARVRERIEAALLAGPGEALIDWRALYRTVVERWAERLDSLGYLLRRENASSHDGASLIQRHLRVMLTPYALHSAQPPIETASTRGKWAAPIWHLCGTRLTAYIHDTPSIRSSLTNSESTLLRALDETNREICRRVVRMWSRGVEAGADMLIGPGADDMTVIAPAELETLVRVWRVEAAALVDWLDWSVWVRCMPACGPEEFCYLPTWPYFWRGWEDHDNPKGPWNRPKPRCIRQFAPYSNLAETED